MLTPFSFDARHSPAVSCVFQFPVLAGAAVEPAGAVDVCAKADAHRAALATNPKAICFDSMSCSIQGRARRPRTHAQRTSSAKVLRNVLRRDAFTGCMSSNLTPSRGGVFLESSVKNSQASDLL